MQRPEEGQAVIGVDAHKETHAAAAVDWQGALVDERRFATARQGYRQLESRARSLGDVLRVCFTRFFFRNSQNLPFGFHA